MQTREKQNNENGNFASPDDQKLEITFYTDPLCCWSWAFEPQRRKLLYEFSGDIKFRYCMGGLLPGWKNYFDSVNSISRPAQMGPVWMHASQLSGMPIKHNIWMTDPPASSYLSCIAVKCAGLQSSQIEEEYLRIIREALMIKGENISKQNILLQLAEELSIQNSQFDLNRFFTDFKNDSGLEPFRKDLNEVKFYNINRFPTLVVKNKLNKAVMVSGYRPYNVLLSSIEQLKPLKATSEKIDPECYKSFWGSVTSRELEEIA